MYDINARRFGMSVNETALGKLYINRTIIKISFLFNTNFT